MGLGRYVWLTSKRQTLACVTNTINDRCCINKNSSAELSEAINSMFSWYKNAQVCYAYLSDVGIVTSLQQKQTDIKKSRWFTRGWTLQELLAPSSVVFFSNDWQSLGTKAELSDLLSDITDIDVDILRGLDLGFASVAQKMSWASARHTTRVEDVAYCLLGIFNVNMPLLYGEGNKAFHRLQEEILKGSNDLSLFAWGIPYAIHTLKTFKETIRQQSLHDDDASPNDEFLGRPFLRGAFAVSPAEFANSKNVISLHYAWFLHDRQPPIMSNGGVRLDLPLARDSFASHGHKAVAQWEVVRPYPGLRGSGSGSLNSSVFHKQAVEFRPPETTLSELAHRDKAYIFVVLGCCFNHQNNHLLGLVLRPWGKFFFGRLPEPVLLTPDQLPNGERRTSDVTFQLAIVPERALRPMRDQDFRLRHLSLGDTGYGLCKVECIPSASYKPGGKIVAVDRRVDGPQAAFLFEHAAGTKGVVVVMVGLDLGQRLKEQQAWVSCFPLTAEQSRDWVDGEVPFETWAMTADDQAKRQWSLSRRLCELEHQGTKFDVRVAFLDSYQGPHYNEIYLIASQTTPVQQGD